MIVVKFCPVCSRAEGFTSIGFDMAGNTIYFCPHCKIKILIGEVGGY